MISLATVLGIGGVLVFKMVAAASSGANVNTVGVASAFAIALAAITGIITAITTRNRGAAEGFADLTRSLQQEREDLIAIIKVKDGQLVLLSRRNRYLETLVAIHGIKTEPFEPGDPS